MFSSSFTFCFVVGSGERTALGNTVTRFPLINMKKMQFNDTSIIWLYHEDDSYAKRKAFSKADRERFRANALRDATRVLKILRQAPQEASLPTQLRSCGIPLENIVGLEHLILEKHSSSKRKKHIETVLAEHTAQMRAGRQDFRKLAKLSSSLSKRPASQARKRARAASCLKSEFAR